MSEMLDGDRTVFDRLWIALDESLAAIHAIEKLGDIQRGGYPRPKQEATLHAIIDQFLDKRRALLDHRTPREPALTEKDNDDGR